MAYDDSLLPTTFEATLASDPVMTLASDPQEHDIISFTFHGPAGRPMTALMVNDFDPCDHGVPASGAAITVTGEWEDGQFVLTAPPAPPIKGAACGHCSLRSGDWLTVRHGPQPCPDICRDPRCTIAGAHYHSQP